MKENVIKLENEVEVDYIKEIENKFPKTALEFKKIQEEQYKTFCSKLFDYGPYNVSLGREIKTDKDIIMCLAAIGVRCAEKTQRIINLLFYTSNSSPKNEPLIDSFLDISVYGIIAGIIKSGKWGK